MKVKQKSSGFTLIELLITVAIIGILASIAYPSYTDFVLRSNRSEAQRELLRYANLQEQVFVDTHKYATDMKGLGETTVTVETDSKNYVIKIDPVTATTYTLKATAQNGQTADTGCTGLTVNELGIKTPAACWEK